MIWIEALPKRNKRAEKEGKELMIMEKKKIVQEDAIYSCKAA